jgi:hypothetical protein
MNARPTRGDPGEQAGGGSTQETKHASGSVNATLNIEVRAPDAIARVTCPSCEKQTDDITGICFKCGERLPYFDYARDLLRAGSAVARDAEGREMKDARTANGEGALDPRPDFASAVGRPVDNKSAVAKLEGAFEDIFEKASCIDAIVEEFQEMSRGLDDTLRDMRGVLGFIDSGERV